MGIHGLMKLIGDYAPGAMKDNDVKSYFGETPAVRTRCRKASGLSCTDDLYHAQHKYIIPLPHKHKHIHKVARWL